MGQRVDDAKSFKREFQPSVEVDADWIVDYAKWRFEALSQTWNELDAKADSLIRYLGGGTGLLALGAIASIDDKKVWVFALALPAFVLALIGVCVAAAARNPSKFPWPPMISKAFNRVGEEGGKQLFYVADWNLACAHLHEAITKKSDLVQRATTYYQFAVGALSLPLVGGVFLYAWW